MDALDAIGDAGLREALLYVRSVPHNVTIRELAAAQKIHYNVARRRLERLVTVGLLTSGFRRTSGRSGPGAGRPAKTYAPTPDTAAVEFPQRFYPQLVGLLLDAAPRRRLGQIGVEYGTALAAKGGIEAVADLQTGLERMCAAMGSLGFQASLGDASADQAEIITPTCPLRPLVAASPDVAEVDRGLWRGLVAAALAGVDADDIGCTTHDCLDPCASCRIVLRLEPPDRAGRSRSPVPLRGSSRRSS
jgi:predicted ArsR family transcriptional regulator